MQEGVRAVHNGGVEAIPPPSAVSANFVRTVLCCTHTAFQFGSAGEGGGAGGDGLFAAWRAVPGCRTPYVHGMATPAVRFTACVRACVRARHCISKGQGKRAPADDPKQPFQTSIQHTPYLYNYPPPPGVQSQAWCC